MTEIGIFDTVRIRATVEAEQLGVAGRTGLVYGCTAPSVTGVQVIGCVAQDRALSVKVEGQDDPLWFDPDLLEFLNHTPGLRAKVGNRSCTRGESGEWIEDTPSADDRP
jgi:hypothetical protein